MLAGNSIQVDAKGVWIVRLDQRQACPIGEHLGASIEPRLVAVRPHPETEAGILAPDASSEPKCWRWERKPASTARRLWRSPSTANMSLEKCPARRV